MCHLKRAYPAVLRLVVEFDFDSLSEWERADENNADLDAEVDETAYDSRKKRYSEESSVSF